MGKRLRKTIISFLLIAVLLVVETMCVSAAETIQYTPFAIGQTLSGTLGRNGEAYYTFTLNKKTTIRFKGTFNQQAYVELGSPTTYSYKYGSYSHNDMTYNSITGLYTLDVVKTLEKGTYTVTVEDNANTTGVSYSLTTSASDAESVSGTPGTIKIGIRLKKGKTLQLSSILSGMSGKTTWKSSKKSVAKVTSKGKVTARKKGTATITAKCNGKTAKIKIKVY